MLLLYHFYDNYFHLNYMFRISVIKYFWFCKCATPWMFPLLIIFLEYRIEHVILGLLNVMFTFPTRIFYRGAPGSATDCPCGVWCRGLTTCLLYVGPLFGNLVENDSRFINCTFFFNCFTYILMTHNMMVFYFHLLIFMFQLVFYHQNITSVLSFHIDVLLTLSNMLHCVIYEW